MLDRDTLVAPLRAFKTNAKDAFYSVDQRTYSALRDGYLDKNLNLTPAAYRLLHDHPEGMRND